MCRAFLALGDEPELAPARPRARAAARVCAVLAAAALAIATPLAWASATLDRPLATATKFEGAVHDGEEEDRDVPPDDPAAQAKTATGGEPWAAATA